MKTTVRFTCAGAVALVSMLIASCAAVVAEEINVQVAGGDLRVQGPGSLTVVGINALRDRATFTIGSGAVAGATLGARGGIPAPAAPPAFSGGPCAFPPPDQAAYTSRIREAVDLLAVMVNTGAGSARQRLAESQGVSAALDAIYLQADSLLRADPHEAPGPILSTLQPRIAALSIADWPAEVATGEAIAERLAADTQCIVDANDRGAVFARLARQWDVLSRYDDTSAAYEEYAQSRMQLRRGQVIAAAARPQDFALGYPGRMCGGFRGETVRLRLTNVLAAMTADPVTIEIRCSRYGVVAAGIVVTSLFILFR